MTLGPSPKGMKSNNSRKSFRDVLNASRPAAAREAWRRARRASQLRHAARGQGNRRAALQLAEIKRAAIFRAVSLSPAEVRVSIDRLATSPHISIRFNNAGALHLPLHGTHRRNLILLGLGRARATRS